MNPTKTQNYANARALKKTPTIATKQINAEQINARQIQINHIKTRKIPNPREYEYRALNTQNHAARNAKIRAPKPTDLLPFPNPTNNITHPTLTSKKQLSNQHPKNLTDILL